jgi:resuscitation-promoting factor RpfB
MSILSPNRAKLLRGSQFKQTPFLIFFISLVVFSGIMLLPKAIVSAHGDVEDLQITEYRYDPHNPSTLLLTADIETSLFTPNHIHIYGDGFEYEFFTYAETTLEAVNELEIEFDNDDIFLPELNSPIVGNMWIRYTKVDNEFEEVKSDIPFTTSVTFDSEMTVGRDVVVTKGQLGVRLETFRITYQDGVKVNRELVSSVVESTPINEAISRGTHLGGGKNCTDWDAVIDSMTSDPEERFWLKSVMRCESGCNERNVSRSGAYKGLFQYNTSTFNSGGGGDIFDGTQQIEQTIRRYRAGQLTKWPACNKKTQASMPSFD